MEQGWKSREQGWRSRLRLCTKVFAVGSVVLFVTTMLLGRGTDVSVMVLLAAVGLVLVVAAVDGISAVSARIRERE